MEGLPSGQENLADDIGMENFWKKLKELYDMNPTLFGIALFIDLLILYFIIQYFIS